MMEIMDRKENLAIANKLEWDSARGYSLLTFRSMESNWMKMKRL
jgi:hypothetical protein